MMEVELFFLSFLAFVGPIVAVREVNSPEALRIAPPPMTFDEVSSKCWNFTRGNYQKMEFYSPGFPLKYTNDTDCVLYLEAPRNFVIQLDFREVFKIENSEKCKYDFLEVRDGPFAYSPLIQRYCGSSFPPLLTSSSRHLWLRFKSDDLIQDQGFRAIYSYIKQSTQSDRGRSTLLPAPPVCREYVEVTPDQPDGVLYSSRLPGPAPYQVPRPFDCTWEIHTDANYGIYVRSHNLTFEGGQRCDENYVALYKRTTLDQTKYVQHCSGSHLHMKTRHNRVFIRLYGKTTTFRPQLNLIFTIFKKDARDCTDEDFSCDGMCLSKILWCNGVSNCPSEQDEHRCMDKSVSSVTSTIPLHTIVAGSIGGVVFTAIIIGICVSCHYKRRSSKRQKNLQEELKKKQKKALEKAACSPSTTIHTLSRQNEGASPRQQHGQFSTQINDNPHRYSFCSSAQHSSDGDTNEALTEMGNYKRFLSLEAGQDEESSPCPCPPVYNQTSLLNERYPALEPHPRFVANAWRTDDNLLYPYSSLKKNGQFAVSKPYCYSPENQYSNPAQSLNSPRGEIHKEQ